jgi:CelD/BcsL family acetyltransferase involved in cellulose biosynthesis
VTLLVEVARGAAELASLRGEWDALWARCPWATAFQTPEWLLAWCAAFAPSEPFAVLVRDREGLVGIAPMCVLSRDDERVLLPIGAGVSDSLDMLLAPACADAAADAIWGHLLAKHATWDAIDFGGLAADSPFVRRAPSGAASWEDEPWMGVILDESHRALDRVVAPWLRENVRHARRRAEREDVAVERVVDEDVPLALERICAAHSARWAERAEKGIFADPRVLAFHRCAVPPLHARGLVRFYDVRTPDAVPAVLYALWHPRRPAFYASGFDPSFRRLSPGVLLVAHVLEEAISEGAERIDFLRGREAYKLAWGATEENRRGVTVRHA